MTVSLQTFHFKISCQGWSITFKCKHSHITAAVTRGTAIGIPPSFTTRSTVTRLPKQHPLMVLLSIILLNIFIRINRWIVKYLTAEEGNLFSQHAHVNAATGRMECTQLMQCSYFHVYFNDEMPLQIRRSAGPGIPGVTSHTARKCMNIQCNNITFYYYMHPNILTYTVYKYITIKAG